MNVLVSLLNLLPFNFLYARQAKKKAKIILKKMLRYVVYLVAIPNKPLPVKKITTLMILKIKKKYFPLSYQHIFFTKMFRNR